jgi:serine/threonine-protein kinase
MASVHLGRLSGDLGFAKTVAIKRLHPAYAKNPEFVAMFLDEARLAARVSHPNVVQILDVVALESELFLVMEYVRGESLSVILKRCAKDETRLPCDVACAIVYGALEGLHAAHEARDTNGSPMGLVHRDVSPHNVIVGADGVGRVLDFGIAKAINRLQTTRDGQLKGKLAYMAPEQIAGAEATVRSDVYAAGIVLWEALTARRCYDGDTPAQLMARINEGHRTPIVEIAPGTPPELDAIVLRACDKDPSARFASAHEMALAIEKIGLAPPSRIATVVEELAGDVLAVRAAMISEIESPLSRSGAHPRAANDAGDGPLTGSMPAPSSGRPSVSPFDATAAEAPSSRKSLADADEIAGVPPPPGRGRWLVLGAIAGVVLVGGIATTLALRAQARVDPGPVSSSSAPPSSPPPSIDSAPPPEPAPEAPPSSAAAATTKPRPTRTAAGPVRPPPSAPVTAAKPSCDPPYSLGPNGRRIPKPECL